MNNSVNTKRIAKNTLIIYFQVFVSMIIGLVSSRLVLQSLGALDFGLYNVVGGVIAMFTFISGAMSTTTTRFFNFEMGKPDGDMNRVFNISYVLHLCVAIVLLLLLEVGGIYYISKILNVESGKESDAMFVFQVSTLVACVGITNVPYRGVLVAHERFSSMALIEITKTIVKLLLVVCLFYYRGNGLRFYALSMAAVTFISFFAYRWLVHREWPATAKWNFVRQARAYRGQLGFSSWNLLSTMAITARSQGTHLLINAFYGTSVNAAYAVSRTVERQVNVLSENFVKAANPQITKLLGGGNRKAAYSLAADVSRMNLLLTEIGFFTLFIELNTLLHLWLGPVLPKGTLEFCQYTLLVAVVSSTSAGVVAIISGFGKIKWFKLQFTILFMLCLVTGYYSYSAGLPAYSILIWYIVADILNRIIQLILLNRMFSFDVGAFLKSAFVRPFVVSCILCFYVFLYRQIHIDVWVYRLVGVVIMFLTACIIVFAFGLKCQERRVILFRINQVVSKLV